MAYGLVNIKQIKGKIFIQQGNYYLKVSELGSKSSTHCYEIHIPLSQEIDMRSFYNNVMSNLAQIRHSILLI